MASDDRQSFGIFKPVGHVVICFPRAAQADAAARALVDAGVSAADVRRLTDREMLTLSERDLHAASAVADVGQDLNLVHAHRQLAARGYHWLIVRAPGVDAARRVSDIAQAQGAERAQRYGTFIIEEMIDAGLPQVAESPARGLDDPRMRPG